MALETLAAVGLGLGSGLEAIGSIQQGFAARQQGEYNARVAEQNAAAARQQAALDESTSRKKSAMVIGSIRARAAANTGDVGGSALDVLADSAGEAELEALTLRYAGEVKARQSESEAKLQRQRGESAFIGGFIGAGTALLKGGARLLMPTAAASEGSAIPALSTRVPYLSSSGRKIGPV